MIDVLKLDNVKKLFTEYTSGNDLYPTLVGLDNDMPQSSIDSKKMLNYVDFTSRLEEGMFMKEYSPHETYMYDPDFCRAISPDFDLNNIAHRLYFNFGDNRIDFVNLFINGCYSKNVPFCLKFDKKVTRKDSLVAYIEEDKLAKTSEVLASIIDRHPQFAESRDMPMSVVDGGWFGYGIEDKKDNSVSYNRKFAQMVERAFFDVELFNKYRQSLSLNGSLTQFAENLYLNAKNEAILEGVDPSLLGMYDTEFRQMFDNLKLQFVLNFFSGPEREGSGFVKTDDQGNTLDIQGPVYTVKNANGDFSINISPSAVLKTVFDMMKVGQMSFYPSSDEYNDVINQLSNNIRDGLSAWGMPLGLPQELMPLAKENVSGVKEDSVVM